MSCDVKSGLLYVCALIEDSVYVRGSQTLVDPPEHTDGYFWTEIPLDLLESVDFEADNVLAQLEEVDLEIYDWQPLR
jgi:hypothetical protein